MYGASLTVNRSAKFAAILEFSLRQADVMTNGETHGKSQFIYPLPEFECTQIGLATDSKARFTGIIMWHPEGPGNSTYN